MYDVVSWSDELAPDGLPKPEQKTVSSPLPSSLVPFVQKAPPVFPVLKGFGSLNNTAMPDELKKMLDSFFSFVPSVQKIVREKNQAVNIQPEKEKKTELSDPAEKPTVDSPQKTATQPDRLSLTDFLNPARVFLPTLLQYAFQNVPPVERVIYGEVFPLEDCFEIPARLYGEDTYTDCFVYAVQQKDGTYLIDQIQFGETLGSTVFPN